MGFIWQPRLDGSGRAAADVRRAATGLRFAAALLIGAGLAACFPVVLSYVGDLYPSQSGTAFSTVFFAALIGNMSINKALRASSPSARHQQYTRVMLVCLVCSALLLFLVTQQLRKLKSKPDYINEQRREAMAR